MTSASLTASSQAAIRAGSKSFALASALFGRRERETAWRLYAWCRHCDDVVDGQTLGHGMQVEAESAQARLATLRALTLKALQTDEAAPDAFQALRETARAAAIPAAQPLALLDGFAMDVERRRYETLEDTLEYAFHVAGVVGVMMAELMGVRDGRTLERASDLGLAFQLTNIARDVVEDAENGRVYLPAAWLREAGVAADPEAVRDPTNRAGVAAATGRLLDEAEAYYRSARGGLGRLPFRSAWAIATARGVYRGIGREVRRRGAAAWDERTHVSASAKVALLIRGAGVALATRGRGPARARPPLWTPPAALMASGEAAPRAVPSP